MFFAIGPCQPTGRRSVPDKRLEEMLFAHRPAGSPTRPAGDARRDRSTVTPPRLATMIDGRSISGNAAGAPAGGPICADEINFARFGAEWGSCPRVAASGFPASGRSSTLCPRRSAVEPRPPGAAPSRTSCGMRCGRFYTRPHRASQHDDRPDGLLSAHAAGRCTASTAPPATAPPRPPTGPALRRSPLLNPVRRPLVPA